MRSNLFFLDCDEHREAFRQRLNIEFCVGSPEIKWNLHIARLIFQLWEMVQLHNINLDFDMGAGDLSRKYLLLSDYRLSCKFM